MELVLQRVLHRVLHCVLDCALVLHCVLHTVLHRILHCLLCLITSSCAALNPVLLTVLHTAEVAVPLHVQGLVEPQLHNIILLLLNEFLLDISLRNF